ncbi:MAG: hypothetical protein M1829_002284 [Trizodia sp. TS-e1964]|nr:MAG: hypothetical protein M1829_002284 [Trizodia sp. TS-e1964]
MHDLRRQALESGKTVSRKAQSRQSSRASSRANSAVNSRANSRNPSRQCSDEEEGNLSDGTAWSVETNLLSVNSIEDLLTVDEGDSTATDAWTEELGDRIEQILNQKKSSTAGREESLFAYVRLLTSRFAPDQIHGRSEELIAAFLKSIKKESSEKETALALRALALTTITEPLDQIFDLVHSTLKHTIIDSESILPKAAAIHALAACLFFGGGSEEELSATMALFLEIIESDGNSANAPDSTEVVTAALEEWGFLATQIEDFEEESQAAMEAFVEQLESAHSRVQIAAGENIALVYEKSYTEREEDEAVDSSDEDDEENTGVKLIKRYEPYRNTSQLKYALGELANVSSRRLSKKDRKSLHTNFADILQSVENPTLGPRHSNALDPDGRRYGSRMTVRIQKSGHMKIDRWWKLQRLQALRRLLGGGFVTHYEKNETIFDCLPIMISADK